MNKKLTYISLLFFLFQSNICNSQYYDFIKLDTLNFNKTVYKITHISFGKTSHTKYYKVLICKNKDFNDVKNKIIECVSQNNLDYSEFYILPIKEPFTINYNSEILVKLILKIDNQRMEQNLSTNLIKCRGDGLNMKFEYFVSPDCNKVNSLPLYDLFRVAILSEDVCRFLKN